MPLPPTRLSVVCSVASVAAIVLVPVPNNTLSAPVVSVAELPAVGVPTHSDAVSAPVENAVVPPVPLVVRFTVPPLVPVVWSHALNVSVACPAAPGVVGTKRTSVDELAASSSALVVLTDWNAVQFAPPLMV